MQGATRSDLPRLCCCAAVLLCPFGQVENEDLVFTLETMVEKFGDEIAPYAVSRTGRQPLPEGRCCPSGGTSNSFCCVTAPAQQPYGRCLGLPLWVGPALPVGQVACAGLDVQFLIIPGLVVWRVLAGQPGPEPDGSLLEVQRHG